MKCAAQFVDIDIFAKRARNKYTGNIDDIRTHHLLNTIQKVVGSYVINIPECLLLFTVNNIVPLDLLTLLFVDIIICCKITQELQF